MKVRLNNIYRRLDKLVFPVRSFNYDLADLDYCGHFSFKFNPFANIAIDKKVADAFYSFNDWDLMELHYIAPTACIIDPDTGWARTKNRVYYPLSNINNHIHNRPKPIYSKYLLKKKVVSIEKTHSFHFGSANYWHFLNDLIGQIHLSSKLGFDDLTIVVPAVLGKSRFFKDFLEACPIIKSRNWLFQEPGQFVLSKEAHFFNTFYSHKNNFNAVLDYLQVDGSILDPLINKRRLFIGRKGIRRIVNLDAVLPLLEKYCIEYIELEGCSLKQQISLFQQASHVIGIHGAGLTNIIFCRGQRLSVLELFADCYINPAYYWIAVQYGFDYAALAFAPNKKYERVSSADFLVDIHRLDIALAHMFQ